MSNRETIQELLKAIDRGEPHMVEVISITHKKGFVQLRMENPDRNVVVTDEVFEKVRSHLHEQDPSRRYDNEPEDEYTPDPAIAKNRLVQRRQEFSYFSDEPVRDRRQKDNKTQEDGTPTERRGRSSRVKEQTVPAKQGAQGNPAPRSAVTEDKGRTSARQLTYRPGELAEADFRARGKNRQDIIPEDAAPDTKHRDRQKDGRKGKNRNQKAAEDQMTLTGLEQMKKSARFNHEGSSGRSGDHQGKGSNRGHRSEQGSRNTSRQGSRPRESRHHMSQSPRVTRSS